MAKAYYESTGLVNALQITGSRKALLDSGFIKFYAGAVPANADASLGGATLLCTLTNNGDGVTGLTFENAATDGIIQKNPSEVWRGTPVASGAATFFRWEMTGDSGGQSSTDIRVQGLVGNVGSDANLTDINFQVGVDFTLPVCAHTQPKSLFFS